MRNALRVAAPLVAFVLATVPATAFAAVDAFLFIADVKGGAMDEKHRDWIEVSSFQWGSKRGVGSPMGGTSDRESSAPSVSEIVVTKVIDRASPLLSKCAATGCHYRSVILEMRKAGGNQMVRYVLSNVMVSGYHVSSGGDRPTESLSLNFTKIEMRAAPEPTGATHLTPARSNTLKPISPETKPR
jgi:type VI secretion system secreted protein Hcp